MTYLKEITFNDYAVIFNNTAKNVERVKLHSSQPPKGDDIRFFRSDEGISYLCGDGYMGGLLRFNFRREENLSKLHQEQRVFKGGHFLDCYDGKLVELYKKQGFKIVARVPFNSDYAPKGWEEDKDLKRKPDVVFLSKRENVQINYLKNYDDAYNYARG